MARLVLRGAPGLSPHFAGLTIWVSDARITPGHGTPFLEHSLTMPGSLKAGAGQTTSLFVQCALPALPRELPAGAQLPMGYVVFGRLEPQAGRQRLALALHADPVRRCLIGWVINAQPLDDDRMPGTVS
jgi:hypothetical protein